MPVSRKTPTLSGRNGALRRWVAAAMLGVVVTIAGCAAPAPGGEAMQAEPTRPAAPSATPGPAASLPAQAAPRPAPPMSDPLPPVREPEPQPKQPASVPVDAPVVVDTSCRSNADCTIKNVGNCCGKYPACVNVNSPTDPEGVQARCAQSGMASVCGFPAITACQCVAGECQGDGAVTQ